MNTKPSNNIPFGDALFFLRGRLTGPVKHRGEHWLFTMVVRHGDKVFFPTITLTAEPPAELRYLSGVAQRYQQMVVVSGIPETRNVTYTTIGEISYLLRRAGFPGLIRLFKQLLPAKAQKAPQRHVRYNFMARPEDVNIEETPEPPKSTDAQTQEPAAPVPDTVAPQIVDEEPETA